MMIGYGGTSKTGKKYHYYACKTAKKGQCQKKIVNKKYIEDRAVQECRKLLTDNNIERIAKEVAATCESDYDSSAVKRIKVAVQETNEAIENLWKALEHGQSVEMIIERIEKRKEEKEDLQAQLSIEMSKQIIFTAPQIRSFLYSLKKGNINDENNRRGLINIFLRAIYLKDDRFTLILNGGNKPTIIDDILLDEIEAAWEDGVECSSLAAGAPPMKGNPQPLRLRVFLVFSMCTAFLPFQI